MDAPLNEKIERTLKRKAARKKNDSNFLPVLSLHEQVLALVSEANSKVPQERQVTPRSALIVMNRAVADLSALNDEARSFAVLKEVSRFLNVATKTFTASQTDNTDLLVAGHPLSALNASISFEEFLKKNAEWIAADPSINESIRPLVASAHAAAPGSIEREHAFARLAANKTLLASYFKVDNLSALVAAFSDGNSSAARRARVALQWRDKKGRWVEMGRGVNFRFRLPDGSIQVASGNYVGAGGTTRVENTSKGPSLVADSGLIEVSGVPGLEPGLYVINSNNAAVYQARIPGYAAPEKPSFKDQLDADIPSLADLSATRREAPIGWTDRGAYLVSDDNYAVILRNGQPYSVLRLNADGRPAGDAIARVRDWAEVNAAITKDEPAFDKEIALIESDKLPLGRIPGADAKDIISAEDLLKMQEQRAQENKEIDAGKPAPQPLGNNDLNGNPVPEGWVRDANNDRAYTRELPLRDGGTYPIIARLQEDGTYIAGTASGWIPEPDTEGRGPSRKFDTLDAVNKDGVPDLIKYLNDTFTKDNPIEYTAPKEDKIAEVPSAPAVNITVNTDKVVSPSEPVAPKLFIDFNAPDGAFQLRTVDYTPEGRVDEASRDFTDDPKKLATKFTPQELVQAMSQALLGNSTDAAIEEILNANVDSNNDMLDPADIQDSIDIPRVNVGQPSGAGQLEFSAGAEYVQAEALFNAIWEAGLDPNRVIANIYDSANGNNDNLNKLIEAQGGVPSAEEARLVDDIVQEIRQLKDASSPGDSPIANRKQSPSPDPLPGSLIENIPIDFNNPDYYIPNPEAYIPSQPTVDENGYTDNPEILSADYEVADLIEQMLSGITDGSGAALLAFDNITVEVPIEAMRDAIQYQDINTNQILLDLKKESNDMSETSSSPSSESSTLQAHSQMIKDLIEQTGNTVDNETADKIRDAIDQEGLLDWSEADDAEIIDAITEVAGPGMFEQAPTPAAERRFPPTTGERQAIETPVQAPREEAPTPSTPETPFGDNEVLNSLADEIARVFVNGFGPDNKVVGVYEGNAYNRSMIAVANDGGDDNQVILFTASRDGIMTNYSAAGPGWFTGPGSEMGWRQLSPEESSAIAERVGTYTPEEPIVQPEPAPEPTPRAENPDVRPAPSAPAGPVYPGPENRGYHRDNTVLDAAGKVMGYGTRVRASRDGRTGTVIAVQNIDNTSGERIPYVRIRFDDGTIAVRSALKVRSMDDVGQAVPVNPADRARVNPPMPNLQDRLNTPNPIPGLQASEGNIAGVQLVDTPEDITPYVNPDLTQAQFEAWGLRAGEIARAGRERAKLDSIAELARLQQIDIVGFRSIPDGPEKDAKKKEIDDRKKLITRLLSDAFGARDGVKFGANDFYLTSNMNSTSAYGDETALQNNTASIVLSQNMSIHDKDGRVIGEVRRSMTRKTDANGVAYWEVKNEYMVVSGGQKKNGFATAYNRYMEDWYIANGVKEIHVMAAGGGQYQGAFVWALNGFNWETGDYASNAVPRRVRDLRAMATNDGEKAALDRIEKKFNDSKNPDGTINLDTVPTPLELALVGWYPGAKDWIGKKYMTQNGWHGVKRLDPTKREQVQAINYDQQRRAEKRVAAKENKPNVSREFALTANSNEFETNNPALQPYMSEIRDVLQNNRSLAVLSPSAKTALSRYVSEQILKGQDRQLPLADAFQLRAALDAEAYADNPRMSAKDFGAGEMLAAADFETITRNQVPGFSVRELGHDESGYNSTYLVTHLASGQVFYVKQDDLARDYGIDAAQAEVEAGILLRALNMQGTYETRVNPSTDNAIIMQQAGSNMSLGSVPMVAYQVFRDRGIIRKDGSTLSFREDDLAENLHSPEDIVRMALLDLIINNEDRHNGNVLLAVDGRDQSRVRVLPIDHSLAQLNPDGVDEFRLVDIMQRDGNNIYAATMPVLTKRMKEDELLAMFRNEANRMRTALNDDSILPTGKELEKLIRRWGSLENYRAAINTRLDALLTPGGSEHGEFQQILNKRYWN